MKKRTHDQTWDLHLEMWKWIAEVWEEDDDVNMLKAKWLCDNGYKDIKSDCFFCNSTVNQYGLVSCYRCPGSLVDPNFDCNEDKYNYMYNPKAFYAESLRLNKIRLAE